jgi:mycofactocin system creatininase family protein
VSELAALSCDALPGPEAVLAIPLGATEQHGPHLPLGTDTAIATALAQALAQRRPEVVVAPAIAYGSSGEHQSFPGTLSIGQEAIELLVVELVRSATETFDRVLLVCAHGGNAAAVERAVTRLRAERRDVRAWDPATVWHGDAHAGQIESSVMLALAPDTVDMARAAAGNTSPVRALLPAMARGGVEAVSANGVLGDPTDATPEFGRALLARARDALETFVVHWTDAADR